MVSCEHCLYLYRDLCRDLALQSGHEPDRAFLRAVPSAVWPVSHEKTEGVQEKDDGGGEHSLCFRG